MSRPLDTTRELDAHYRDMMQAQSPSDRVVMACGMFDIARAAILATLDPDGTEATRRVHLFMRLYGQDFDVETAGRIAARLAAWRGRP